jgi:hypothetical protein
MPRGLAKIVARVRALAAQRAVRFTLKAVRELSSLGLDELDAFEALADLKTADFHDKFASVVTGEWMYVFKPLVGNTQLYVKLILRDHCVVVSFHDDHGDDDEDEGR